VPGSIYGDAMAGGFLVRAAAKATLQAWLPQYLAEVGRRFLPGGEPLPAIQRWETPHSFEDVPLHHTPLVAVTTPGLVDEPQRDGRGLWRGRMATGVVTVVAARDRDACADLADLYELAIRTCLLQHPSLGGHVDSVGWADTRYDELRGVEAQFQGAATMLFVVELELGYGAPAGPEDPELLELPVPSATEDEDWPTITAATVTVEAKD
jgi:hypothetical protein